MARVPARANTLNPVSYIGLVQASPLHVVDFDNSLRLVLHSVWFLISGIDPIARTECACFPSRCPGFKATATLS